MLLRRVFWMMDPDSETFFFLFLRQIVFFRHLWISSYQLGDYVLLTHFL